MMQVKFRYLVVAVLLMFSARMSAQNYGYADNFRDNWFVSGALGVNALNEDVGHFDSPAGFALDFNVGKWFSPLFGVRAGWQGLTFANDENRFGYNYLHADVMWDFMTSVDGYRADRFWSLIPYVNMGAVLTQNSLGGSKICRDFGAGVGLMSNFRINSRLNAYIDLRSTMLNERAIAHKYGHLLMISGLAGLQVNLGKSGWDMIDGEVQHGRPVNKGFWSDFFFSSTGGVNSVWNASGMNSPAASAEFAVGKWLSPYAAVRAAAQGLLMNSPAYADRMNFAYVHADIMWDWVNTFSKTKGGHMYTLAPYVHLGVFNSFEHRGGKLKTEFASGFGLYNSIALGSRMDFILDLRMMAVNGRAMGSQNGGVYGQANILAGLAYNLGDRNFNIRRFTSDASDSDSVSEKSRTYSGKKSGSDTEYNGFSSNWSVYVAGGANVLSKAILHPSKLGYRPAFDLGISKMFSPSFGARLGLQANSIKSSGKVYGWQYVHADVLWDMRGCFGGYDPDRIWSVAPYMSMGMSFVEDQKNSIRLAAGPGILNSWKLSDRLSMFVDMRSALLNERQIGSPSGFALEVSALAGLSIDISKNYWDENGNGVKLNKLWDNWFIQTSGGMELVLDTWQRFNGRPATAMDIAVGKWFSPEWGARLGMMYSNMSKDDNKQYDCGYVHADVLWNMSNAVASYDANRIYTASPYLHFGLMGSWNHYEGKILGKDYTTGIGLLNDFKIDDKMSLILDLRGRAMFGRLTGKTNGKALGGDILLGMSYNLGNKTWETNSTVAGPMERGPLAISTNLVSWADLATINFGIEYATGRHWSADMTFEYNAWEYKNSNLQSKHRSVTMGARYWPWHTYSGAWIRTFLGAEDINREGMPLKLMNRAEDRLGAGISAGYSLMLAKNLNLDFGLGLWAGARHDLGGAWGGFIAPKDLRISLLFVL